MKEGVRGRRSVLLESRTAESSFLTPRPASLAVDLLIAPDTSDPSPSRRIRVFVADDHPLVLSGLKAVIATDRSLQLVGEACSGSEALQGAVATAPDVLVLDICMPGLNGFEVAKSFLAAHPRSAVVFLTVLDDQVLLRRAAESGVAGFVLKRSATDHLVSAIQIVAAGGSYVDSTLGAAGPPAIQAGRSATRRSALDRLAERIAALWRRRT